MQRLYYKYFISPDNTYAGYVDFTFTGLYLDCLTKSHVTRIILFCQNLTQQGGMKV